MKIIWILPVIIGVLLLGTSDAFAGVPVTYSSNGNGLWNSPGTWLHPNPDPMLPPLTGVPGIGDDKLITHTVTISSPVNNAGLVQVGGTLIINNVLTNTGFFDGVTTRGLVNFGTVTFTTGSTFHNNGLFDNFGAQLNINSGAQFNQNCAGGNGHFHNEQGNVLLAGILNSTGDIHQLTNGVMNVTGTLDNSSSCGIMNNFDGSTLDNTGNSIHNHGTINVIATSKLINHANSLINNHIAGKIVLNAGTLINEDLGTIENNGTIDNNTFGTLSNEGKLVNNGIITSASEIKNLYKGLIEQKNIFTNENGGILNNFGELNVTSIMTNDAGGIIDNKFDEPKVEFGNIYLFMNITNNGIVNDCGIINPPHKVHPTKPVLCDMDQDYLLDSWENHGIDFNHDKTIDLTLAGANEMHKDLYLEVDYMQNHQPTNAAVTAVVNAFAAAPKALVNNPDGTDGINLHVEVDEQVTHQDSLSIWTGFDAIKKTNFGKSVERPNEAKIDAKKFSYRYGLFIHKWNNTGFSGIAELPGNDFIVSLGGFDVVGGHNKGTDKQNSATLMHEMGHTLNLKHGGGDHFNCKPNYFSIMSYTFQFEDGVPGRPLDYSRQTSPTLNEASLNEMTGVVGPAGRSTLAGNGTSPVFIFPTGVPFNFDRDSTHNEVGVSSQVNLLGNGCNGSGSVLTGFTDWSNIEYDFRTTRDFISDGAPHPEEGNFVEMTFDQVMALAASINPKACVIPESGNWTITEDCTLVNNSVVPGNIIVQNNSVLTISNGLTLTVDLASNSLSVISGSGVLIKSGGVIT